MATTTITTKNAMVFLLLVAILPLTTLSSRAGPSTHHAHAHGPKQPPKHIHPSPPPPSSPPPAPSPSPAALVRSTCNSTTYPDLCVSALAADPSSATADVRGLSAIAVSAAATNASAAAAALANGTAPESAAGTADATVEALLRTCAAKYGAARDALAAARESIAVEDIDFAAVHVSAAAEYPRVCRVLFQRQRPGQYPAELATREEALGHLCSVALDIIALVSSTS